MSSLDVRVIDADEHVNVPPSAWREYLPAKLRDRAPRIEPGAPGDDHDWVVFEGSRKLLTALYTAAGRKVVGWFAWLAEYMDRTWGRQRGWTQSELVNPPSYMDQNVYGSFMWDQVGVANRNRPGGRNIMWSSDYPHSETPWPSSKAAIEHCCAGLSAEERRPILFDNAKRFYGL